MRKGILFLILVVFALQSPLFAEGNEGFERVKSLVGKWTASGKDGKQMEATYELISGGTAVMETLKEPEGSMVTTYYPDGSNLMMTHYCMVNNQPRMRATSASGNALVFEFVDATNLATADTGHMHKLVITIIDNDHIAHEWTWVEKGQQKPERFQLARVK